MYGLSQKFLKADISFTVTPWELKNSSMSNSWSHHIYYEAFSAESGMVMRQNMYSEVSEVSKELVKKHF